MADGDISKILVDIVRTDLPDELRQYIKSDDIILTRLLRAEQRIVRQFEILRQVITVTVPTGTTSEVSLDEVDFTPEDDESPTVKIYKILGFVDINEVLHTYAKIDNFQRKLILSSDQSQPSYLLRLYCVTSLKSDHTIDETHDPEIPEEFHYFLSDYVISGFGYKDGKKIIPIAKSEAEIDAAVEHQAMILWNANRVECDPWPGQMTL